MDLPLALAADLRDLAVDLEANAYTRQTLAMLQRDLRREVRSSLGATISLDHAAVAGCPIVINLVTRPIEPSEIAAALLIPLDVIKPPVEGRVVFYASTVAAFANLATSLSAALDLAGSTFDQHPELPRSSVRPGITGLADFSVVNRAVGVLMNRGHSLADARLELRERAERSRSDLPTAARTVLGSIL